AEVLTAEFSPDGQRILTASADGTARVWVVTSTPARLALADHAGAILAVAISPASRQIVTAGQDGTARLWDAAAGQARRVLSGHKGAVRGVALSLDGQHLA